MKKLFSLLAVAVLGFTACQTDEGVKNATLENEGVVSLNVSVPELATRALDGDDQSGADSAYGAIDYANYGAFLEDNYDVRFQLAVYEAGAAEDAEPIYTAVQIEDMASATNFYDLRFVPGREYQFVLFADFVPQGTTEDFRYNTADLRNITSFEALNAMDETYDAYFHNQAVKVEAGKVNELNATLKRPFGKIRVLATDRAWVQEYADPAKAEVTFYNHAIYKSFNAVTGEVATEATNAEETISYAIDHAYYAATQYEGKEACTLFATYILGKDAQEAVNFRLDTFEADGSLIKSLDFNTEIPYQRNHLTTLVGNLLTNEADLYVRIDDNFDAKEFINGDFENLENGLGYVREGVHVAGQVYEYETNLFSFQLLSETDGTALRAGKYEYTEDVLYLQNATGFRVNGIDVEKGTLTVTDRGTRAGNFYDVVFDIYATINGKTENYILTWNGELKAARTQLAEPVVSYEVDEVDYLYITFSWEAVEGAKNYTVKWNGEEQTVEGTSATFDFSGEDTEATAYVTANPELTWSYTASTGSVTVDWKKPILYTEVKVYLQYIKGDEIAFYNDNYTVYFEKYPSLEGAWYQVAGQIPTPFSKEANVVETTGSAAQVAIFEPTTATCFLYKGAMNPYILTEAEVNWVAGYNTVEVLFSNEAGDAIEFQTTAPMEAGHATIKPTYVAIGGEQAGDIKDAEMNVLLENGEYTIFFTIHSAINDVLMQYVGAINFEKPYAPQYVLTSYTAGAETIYFESENAKFEIEATSLESGDVVVKKIILDGSDDYAASNQVTAATAVVKEENGVYDARYTVTVDLPIGGAKTFDLQYVGPFVPYSAVEPEQVTDFDATYENVEGLAVFTGISHEYKIFVNNLTTIEYDGTQADGWGARSLKFPAGEGFYRFNHGDKLTVDGDDVTLEFVGWNGSKMRMHASTAPAVQEPEEITVPLALENGLYVGGNYKIEYVEEYNYTMIVNNHMDGNLPATIKTSTVVDAGDELVFEFEDTYNNAIVTAIYTKNVVTPAEPLEIMLALDETTGYLVAQYEDTYYTIIDNGKDFAGSIKKGNDVRNGIIIKVNETEEGKYYTFYDELNGRDVVAFYQTSFGPVQTPVNVTFTKIAEGVAVNSYCTKFNLSDEAGNKVSLVVDNTAVAAGKIVDGNYTWVSSADYMNSKNFMFINKSLTVNGATFANADIAGTMTVVGGKITLNLDIFEVAYVLVYTPSNTPVEPEWTNPTYKAEAAGVSANGFAMYTADIYTVADTQWSAPGTDGGTANYTVVDGLHTWTFDDETNKRHVTITYKEETAEPEGPVVYDPWACTAKMEGNYMNATIVLKGTGENTDEIKVAIGQLVGNRENTVSEVTVNGNVVSAEGTLKVEDGRYTVIFNITANGKTYKGQSANGIL